MKANVGLYLEGTGRRFGVLESATTRGRLRGEGAMAVVYVSFIISKFISRNYGNKPVSELIT